VIVPEELKIRMKHCKSVNWSEDVRKTFEDACEKEEMQCAAEEINAEWNGAKEIRKWSGFSDLSKHISY
jgi:hypothetical protein